MPNRNDGRLGLLTDKNSALVLVDYQPTMFAGVASGDKTIIRNAAYCAGKGRKHPERAGRSPDHQPAAQWQFHRGCHKDLPL
ncbi:hypothetical protein [Methanoregula sp.]|uniref:hypothetical protein n=1 Tax=Methanoregula sp. TaxID=2052170 RepID=UPI003569253F